MIRAIESSDYKKGYLELIKQLSKFEYQVDKVVFDLYKDGSIFVIEKQGKIIACGTLFIIKKLHCNPIGQIEDVIVDEEFRGQGLGKRIIEFLISYGKQNGCYKIILNSNEQNIDFYYKCGLKQSGLQFEIR